MKKRHIIIGTSAAAIGCLNKLRALDAESEIMCISHEQEFPYNKCFLIDRWDGQKTQEQVYTKPAQFFTQNNIDLRLGVWVTEIIPDKKQLELHDGQSIAYDTLLIATGARPRALPVPGVDADGVFYFHTLKDLHRIMAYVQTNNPRTAVVVGSGFTGLEVADLLAKKNIRTTVIERGAYALSNFLTAHEGEIVQKAMHEHKVTFLAQEEVADIDISEVTLASGKIIPAELIIIAIGVIPNAELAREAGIALYAGGIQTDVQLQTNIPAIFAAGDVAIVKDQLSGELVRSCMWADAMQQGMVAAYGMAGIVKEYPGVMTTGISSFFGLDSMISGSKGQQGDEKVYQTATSYRKFILSDGLLKAFTMIGELQKVGAARRALMTQMAVDLEELV